MDGWRNISIFELYFNCTNYNLKLNGIQVILEFNFFNYSASFTHQRAITYNLKRFKRDYRHLKISELDKQSAKLGKPGNVHRLKGKGDNLHIWEWTLSSNKLKKKFFKVIS